MNKRAFRLVFDRRRGMKVAAAETTRSSGKAAGGETRASRPARAVAVAVALATLSGGALDSAMAQAVKVKVPKFNAATSRAYDRAYNLPQIYDQAKGASTRGWTTNSDGSASPVGYGQARWRVENGGKRGVFDQGELEKVIANWNSFDIAPGHEVYVKQSLNKDKAVSALFKIWSEDPSLIMGSLRADREVILQNANGVIFGPGATVDTGSLVATALSIADKTFLNGLRASTDGSAVFTADGTDFQATHLGLTTETVNGVNTTVADGTGPARVLVDPGARIRTAAGGDVLLVAPQVENQGTIEVTSGQALLAAGQKVYLAASGDNAQRGLIVAVDAYSDEQRSAQGDLGVVENLARGIDQIKAETGSVNLVGLLVKQNGVINATTAVKGMNGGIFLQAQKSTALINHSSVTTVGNRGEVTPHSTVSHVRQASELGTVEVGADSLTQVKVVLDAAATQLADDPFNASRIFVDGQSITVAQNAQILAAGGDIRLRAASRMWNTAGTDLSSLLFANPKLANIVASTNVSSNLSAGLPNDGSSLQIGEGALISAAGARNVAVDGNRYQGAKRVFRIELADSPLQRGGVLYRQEVFYDKRTASSVKVADLKLDAKAVMVTAEELSAKGGSVALLSQGHLDVANNVLIDVSGGNLNVSESKIKVSSLARKKVGAFSLYEADASQIYDELINPVEGRIVPAYVEGKDAGRLRLTAQTMAFKGRVDGSVILGKYQRGSGGGTQPKAAQLMLGSRWNNTNTANGEAYQITQLNWLAPGASTASAGISLPQELIMGMASMRLDANDQDNLFKRAVGAVQLSLSAETIEQIGMADLSLNVGSRVTLMARQIDLGGRYVLPGGTFEATTERKVQSGATTANGMKVYSMGDIRLADNSLIDLSGLFTNDRLRSSAGTGAVQLDGGTLSLQAGNQLDTGNGSTLNVSAGVHLLTGNGRSMGKAGSIDLAAGKGQDEYLGFGESNADLNITGTALKAFDFSAGGTLKLRVPELVIATAPDASLFTLTPGFFSEGGFGNFQINAWGDVTVAGNVTLQPVIKNWALTSSAAVSSSGAMSDKVVAARATDASVAVRSPVHLALSADAPLLRGQMGSTSRLSSFRGSDLRIQRGAQVLLDPGAKLTLSATGSLLIGTSKLTDPSRDTTVLQALGGTVNLNILGSRGSLAGSGGSDVLGLLDEQAIWLAPNALINVSGVTNLTEKQAALTLAQAARQGLDQATSVLGGGTINIQANRGHVILAEGAQLKLDGHADTVYRPGQSKKSLVVRDAGHLNVSGVESLVLEANLSGRAQQGGNGGTLTVDLGNGINFAAASSDNLELPVLTAYSDAPKVMELGSNQAAFSRSQAMESLAKTVSDAPVWPQNTSAVSIVAQSGLIDGALNLGGLIEPGKVGLSNEVLTKSGFARLNLAALDQILVSRNLSLNAPLGLNMRAPVLQSQGGSVLDVQASHVTLGAPNPGASFVNARTQVTTVQGLGILNVNAGTITLLGQSEWRGFSDATLRANEIRMGANVFNGRPSGGLSYEGALTLQADQVYALSAVKFDVVGQNGLKPSNEGGTQAKESTLTLDRLDDQRRLAGPLTAFGSLGLTAARVFHDGVIWQPFGTVDITGTTSMTLGAHSVTSVSGNGLLVPGGTLLNQANWAAMFPNGTSYDNSLPVSKRITLKAPEFSGSPAATVDASSGGDLQTQEFFPGVGGSTDYRNTKGLWAVLPDHAQLSSLDVISNAGSSAINTSHQTMQLVVSTNGGLLPAGRYTLLPASYAWLAQGLPQGAFLISQATDKASMAALAQPIRKLDGSQVVSGFMVESGANTVGALTQHFNIEAPANFENQSEIRTTTLGQFQRNRRTQLGLPDAQNIDDAGQIQILQTGEQGGGLQLQLKLQGNVQADQSAGYLDISAPKLALVDTLSPVVKDITQVVTSPSEFEVTTSVINDSGAGSVLLGGTRSFVQPTEDAPITTATVLTASGGASTLAVKAAQPVNTQELILSALDKVSVQQNVTMTATGQTSLPATLLSVEGNGALLALSNNNALTVSRSKQGTTPGTQSGELEVGANAALTANNLLLDAVKGFDLASSAAMVGTEQFTLAANRLALGGVSANEDAVVIEGTLLNSALRARKLTLRSQTSIDIVGQQDWRTETSTDNLGQVRQKARMFESVTLDAPDLVAATTSDHLKLSARELVLRNSSGQAAKQTKGLGTFQAEVQPLVSYRHTGGITKAAGQTHLGFASSTLSTTGDFVFEGTGSLSTQGALTLEAARITATTGADQSVLVDTNALVMQTSNLGQLSLGERVGVGAKLSFKADTIEQNTWVDLSSGILAFEATSTNTDIESIRFGNGSLTQTQGFAVQAQDDWTVYGDGGLIQVYTPGKVRLQGTLDVSADTEGSAGQVQITAKALMHDTAQGDMAILGHAGRATGDLGGRLWLDLGSASDTKAIGSFDGEVGLNTLLALSGSTQGSGFSRGLDLRLRTGDFNINTAINAARINLTADGGAITLNSAITADAQGGGVVRLNARDNVNLNAGASISAQALVSADGYEYQGGDVLLQSSQGTIVVASEVADQAIDAGTEGRVKLSTRMVNDNKVKTFEGMAFKQSQLHAQDVVLEAVRVYNKSSLTAADLSTTAAGAMGKVAMDDLGLASTYYQAMGLGAAPTGIRMEAGIEVRSSGDLTLAADWNLDTLRKNDLAGSLTLRAAGNLLINNHLNDGFTNLPSTNAATSAVLSAKPNAWSYRLVGGADTGSADLMATRDLRNSGAGKGDLRVAAAKVVRTGAASIEMAAGQDIVLNASSNNYASVYVAGGKRTLSTAVQTAMGSSTGKTAMTERGRLLSMKARGHISTPQAPNRMVLNWLATEGKSSNAADPEYAAATTGYLAWWTDLSKFNQGVASFGGGNIDIDAGGSITNISVSLPTQAHAKSRKKADGIAVYNGGNLTMSAAGDILGGTYLIGRGQAQIETGGAFAASGTTGRSEHALAIMDGQVTVKARQDIAMNAIFNPTVFGTNATTNTPARAGYFSYGDSASVAMSSLTGDISLKPSNLASSTNYNIGSVFESLFRVVPGSLSLSALSGNLTLNTSIVLYPSPAGGLKLQAAGNVLVPANADLLMLDGANGVRTAATGAAILSTTLPSDLHKALYAALEARANINASNLFNRGATAEMIRISAGQDIRTIATSTGAVANLTLPFVSKITAGRDILNLNLQAQQHQSQDVTTIEAGRNLIQTSTMTGISLGGPGSLVVSAGRQLNLGDGRGIETIANENNGTLPSQGASATVMAAQKGLLNVDAFAAGMLDSASTPRAQAYQRQLVDLVRQELKMPALQAGDDLGAAFAQALQLFKTFPADAQRRFGQQVLAQEFAATYLNPSPLASDDKTLKDALVSEWRQSFDVYKQSQLSFLEGLIRQLQAAAGVGSQSERQALIENILAGVPVALDNEAKSRNLLLLDASAANIATYVRELSTFRSSQQRLTIDQLDLEPALAVRMKDIKQHAQGWAPFVASRLNTSVQAMEALAQQDPASLSAQDKALLTRYQATLTSTSGQTFEDYRRQVMVAETRSAGEAVSNFAVNTWPMLPILYNVGYKVQELAGIGSFAPSADWPGTPAAFDFLGTINITGSTIQTKRGGDITLLTPGGDINVGLKQNDSANSLGLLALGDGNVTTISKGDLQVNTERIVLLGQGTASLWSSLNDLDSGRGSNSAVSSGELVARRTSDGVVFETPPPVSGSGISAPNGTVLLMAPRGEVLATDAFIRAKDLPDFPSPVKGGDNLSGDKPPETSAPIAAPASFAPPSSGAEKEALEQAASSAKSKDQQAQSLMTVELLGVGEGGGSAPAAGASEPPQAPEAQSPEEALKKKKKNP